jgi:hypothetical protein
VSHVTCPLNALARRDPAAAAEQLLPLVYDDLRRLAAYRLGHEVLGQTPRPTAVGHEAYLYLPCGQPKTQRDILGYDLEILPIFMRHEPHAELGFPLEAVDQAAAAQQIDDRITDFVQTYLSMGKNEISVRDRMVEAPIAHVRFSDFAAGACLAWQGRKLYFIGEETSRESEKQRGAGPK